MTARKYVGLALPMYGRVRYFHSGAGHVMGEVDQMAAVVEVWLL